MQKNSIVYPMQKNKYGSNYVNHERHNISEAPKVSISPNLCVKRHRTIHICCKDFFICYICTLQFSGSYNNSITGLIQVNLSQMRESLSPLFLFSNYATTSPWCLWSL